MARLASLCYRRALWDDGVLRGGYGERERAALAFLALDLHLPAECLNDVLYDCEAESAACVPSGSLDLVEALEYVRNRFRRDADSVVGHSHLHEAAIVHRRGDVDSSVFLCELERVVQQIPNDLPHLILLGGDLGQSIRQRYPRLDAHGSRDVGVSSAFLTGSPRRCPLAEFPYRLVRSAISSDPEDR